MVGRKVWLRWLVQGLEELGELVPIDDPLQIPVGVAGVGDRADLAKSWVIPSAAPKAFSAR
ncbi:hypothetical protein N7454_000919 [Penicillium verhagenii]|nr:hypothetical protein N7454_000919 [Penicillium verhagenii]